MKPLRSLRSLRSLLPLLALVALTAPLHAEIFPVSLKIEQLGKTEKTKTSRTQNKSLKITLSNGTQTELSKLTVKFYLFGKDVGDPEVIILNQGEKVADLKPRGTEVVESPSFTATVTEGKPSADKRPKDKGTKFSGYGVQVFDAEQKLVGENFSLPSLKDKVGNKQRPAQ